MEEPALKLTPWLYNGRFSRGDAMPTRSETVIVAGTLRSADGQRQRHCKVQVDKHGHFVYELSELTNVTYSKLSIYDSDDWPDGDYEVEFNGQKELLTKQGRHYVARRGG
jgi:hypothetical protein